MKKTRLFALFCVVVLLVTMMTGVAFAAKKVKVRTAAEDKGLAWRNYRRVESGETVNFFVFPGVWTFFEKNGSGYEQYDDIIYKCKGVVSGKSNVDWISVDNDDDGFILYIDYYGGQKKRTGKVTVTGKNYKAVLKFTQYGADIITSAKRKKDQVTIKIKYGDAPYDYLQITGSKGKKSETIISKSYSKSSYTFTVKKGWDYSVYIGPALKFKYDWGSYFSSDASSGVSFTVNKITGSETYEPWSY